MPDLTLTVNGSRFQGWESISVTRGIDRISDSFDLSVTDKWAGLARARDIKPGYSCEVDINGQQITRGFIDDVKPSYDAESHSIQISGRSRAADLIDCSAIHKSGEWHNKSLLEIARDISDPFNIEVVSNTNSAIETFKRVSIEEGESCFELLERLARQRGVLIISDSHGVLQITKPGNAKYSVTLKEGENILSASGQFTHRDRYSEYIGKGQHAGDDDWNNEQAAQPSASVSDQEIRHRPLIVVAEANATPDSLRQRIRWEKTVRQAKSTNAVITVQGWGFGDDSVWQPNFLIRAISPSLNLNHDVLISKVNYILDEQGTRTELTVVGKNAFNPEPEAEESGGDEWTL